METLLTAIIHYDAAIIGYGILFILIALIATAVMFKDQIMIWAMRPKITEVESYKQYPVTPKDSVNIFGECDECFGRKELHAVKIFGGVEDNSSEKKICKSCITNLTRTGHFVEIIK